MTRDLIGSTLRTVTSVVEETAARPNADQGIVMDLANAARTIVKQNEQAKVTKSLSQLQLDLGQVELEYKKEFESNPQEGLNAFKQKRKELIDSYSENISPLYRGQWNQSVKDFVAKNDALQNKWAFFQTRKNSVKFVNDSINDSLNLAMRDGQVLAENPEQDIDAISNFSSAYENLEKYAIDNLGKAQANTLLKDFEQDYIKSFVSGVSFENPDKALGLLDEKEVQSAFNSVEQYTKMRTAIEKRRDRKIKADLQRIDAESLIGTNEIANAAATMNYTEIQKAFETLNVSKDAQDFYMEALGYTSKKRALSVEEKTDLNNKFYITLSDFVSNDKITMSDMKAFQDATYKAMSKGALTKAQGFTILNNLMDPLLHKQRERAKEFETGDYDPFQKDLGLDSLNEEIKTILGSENFEVFKTGERKGQIKDPQQRFNVLKNKNFMYQVYLQTLETEASNRGLALSQLDNIGDSEEIKIYNKALNNAKAALLGKNFPNSPDGTNTVVSNKISNSPSVGTISINSDTGQRYRFLGGNPNEKKNWELLK